MFTISRSSNLLQIYFRLFVREIIRHGIPTNNLSANSKLEPKLSLLKKLANPLYSLYNNDYGPIGDCRQVNLLSKGSKVFQAITNKTKSFL